MIGLSSFLVTEKSRRPNSVNPREICIYCEQPIGAYHLADCVTVKKTIKLKATIVFEIEVPSDWDQAQIERRHNHGAWCQSNMKNWIDDLENKQGCLCGMVNFEYLETSDKPFECTE